MAIYDRPDVYGRELDLSPIVRGFSTSVGAIVSEFQRGPVGERVLVTNSKDGISIFGKPNVTYGYGMYSMIAALETMERMYITRVVNGALFAGLSVDVAGNDGTTPLTTGLATFDADPSLANRLFTISADNPGAWGNTVKIAIENIDSTEYTFDIVVYETVDGIDILRESWTVSRQQKVDGFNRQLYLEDRINGNSLFIRVSDDTTNADTVLPEEVTAVAFTEGDDGSAVTEANVIAGWGLYEDREVIDINLLINAGYVTDTTYAVQTKIKSICESRRDCFGILDAPLTELGMSPSTDLLTWRNTTQGFNSSFVALYAPWCEVYDQYNDLRNLPIPPSGYVAAVFARRDANRDAWHAPAGLNDGIVDAGNLPFMELTHKYTLGQQSEIYKAGINYLRTFPGEGTAVWGQKTMQVKASALDRINVRRLIIVTEEAALAFLKYKLFELNTPILRRQITETLTQYFSDVQARDGVYDFLVVCDDTNNTPQVIDNYQLNVDVYMQPARAAEFIQYTSVITRTGVEFNTIFNSIPPRVGR